MWTNDIDGPFDVLDGAGALRPGYHLNLPAALPAEGSDPYRVDPPSLVRVYAGDDPTNPTLTVPLRFPDEATARSVLAAYWTDTTE